MNQVTKSTKNSRRFIKETVVVEGKTDTQKLQKLFHVKTIETNGSDLKKTTINRIIQAAKNNGIILFLDPDYQGKKIRNRLRAVLSTYKECFINPFDIKNGQRKNGIAEADDEAIIHAFANYLKTYDCTNASLTWQEYLGLQLNNKNKRLFLCDQLKIEYFNHKQLFKQLNLLNYNWLTLKKILKDHD